MDEKGYIEQFRKLRKNVIVNIVLLSVFLALSISLISYGISQIKGVSPHIYIIIGSTLLFLSIVLFVVCSLISLNKSMKLSGFFYCDLKKENLIDVPQYNISADMARCLNAMFTENKAIRNLWINSEFVSFKQTDKGIVRNTNSERKKILIELIEYCLLNKLSIFVTDYFNKEDISGIKNFTRNDLSSLIISNRFLKLFSEPMENREAFIESKKNDNSKAEAQIVYAVSNGAIYDRFELRLPKKTKIHRKNSTLVIDMDIFSISFDINFDGYSTVMDPEFDKYFLNIKGMPSCFMFEINTKISYKIKTIFKVFNWKRYKWIDEYLERLKNYCDKKTFLDNIQWQRIKAETHVIKNMININEIHLPTSQKRTSED